jgi:hypothetical protein
MAIFLIETWLHQNDKEHESNNNTEARNKEKLIKKIMWLKSQISNVPEHYKDLTIETMMTLPVNNLIVLSDNISDNKK